MWTRAPRSPGHPHLSRAHQTSSPSPPPRETPTRSMPPCPSQLLVGGAAQPDPSLGDLGPWSPEHGLPHCPCCYKEPGQASTFPGRRTGVEQVSPTSGTSAAQSHSERTRPGQAVLPQASGSRTLLSLCTWSWSAAWASTQVMACSSSSVILTPSCPGRAAAMWSGVRAPSYRGSAGEVRQVRAPWWEPTPGPLCLAWGSTHSSHPSLRFHGTVSSPAHFKQDRRPTGRGRQCPQRACEQELLGRPTLTRPTLTRPTLSSAAHTAPSPRNPVPVPAWPWPRCPHNDCRVSPVWPPDLPVLTRTSLWSSAEVPGGLSTSAGSTETGTGNLALTGSMVS